MPTMNWLKQEFGYGYDSGNVTSFFANRIRRDEEKRIGGSYRRVFNEAIRPYVKSNSHVLELGPGKGSWSRSIMQLIPEGTLTTVDFQDVTQWLQPENYDSRMLCNQVTDNTFSCIEDHSKHFFWSMGVLCHNNQTHIREILTNSLWKVKRGGYACHQFADWKKLEAYGWKNGGVPEDFKDKNDDEIWWPRNDTKTMAQIASDAGWHVKVADLGILKRDGLMLLQRI